MKLYDYPPAPSPQRVRFFINEKGISISSEHVDMMTAEQLGVKYKAINPRGTVPALVLDDNTVISEVAAIYRYLEAQFPEPPLLGRTSKEQALIAEWDHRVESEMLAAIADVLRNGGKAFINRALPGELDLEQIPALVDRGRLRINAFFEFLDAQLADNAYVAGDSFSAADITAFVSLGFCSWVKMAVPDTLTHLQDWSEKIAARPGAKIQN